MQNLLLGLLEPLQQLRDLEELQNLLEMMQLLIELGILLSPAGFLPLTLVETLAILIGLVIVMLKYWKKPESEHNER